VGKNVYCGRATAGIGSWEGQAEEPGYITMDGTLQEIYFKVEGPHRPVRIVLHHEDGSGNDSSAVYNLNYDYYDVDIGKWTEVVDHAVDEPGFSEGLGETWERLSSEYRITLQGTNGHIIWVSPYFQLLRMDEFAGRAAQKMR
jgi:hypothetical protein